MTTPFQFQTTYILNKSHFNECFEETAVQDDSFRPYTKAAVLIIFALVLMIATTISTYMSYFVFGLGIVEALGVYYRKPWWIYRQLLSKAADNEVCLSIDEAGIKTHSAFVELTFAWPDISELGKSQLGWLFHCHGARHYISDRCLTDVAQLFLASKLAGSAPTDVAK